MFWAPELNYDRPEGTPEDYVPFATDSINFHPDTYTGDLMIYSPLTTQFEYVDDVEAWTGANTLVLIHD